MLRAAGQVVLAHWAGARVALALDATGLGDRLTILAVSIAYKGCVVPIARKILPATQKHAWKPGWHYGFMYTRYADDLVFSHPRMVRKMAIRLLLDNSHG